MRCMLGEGEFLARPRGAMNRPVADEWAEVVLFEPASTFDGGEFENERSLRKLSSIQASEGSDTPGIL